MTSFAPLGANRGCDMFRPSKRRHVDRTSDADATQVQDLRPKVLLLDHIVGCSEPSYVSIVQDANLIADDSIVPAIQHRPDALL